MATDGLLMRGRHGGGVAAEDRRAPYPSHARLDGFDLHAALHRPAGRGANQPRAPRRGCGDDGCPTQNSATPDVSLIVAGHPAPLPSTTIDTGLSATLLDFSGEHLALTEEPPGMTTLEEARETARRVAVAHTVYIGVGRPLSPIPVSLR